MKLMDQTTYQTVDILIKVLGVLGTVTAIAVALLKEDIVAWWKRVTLSVSADPKNPVQHVGDPNQPRDPLYFLRVAVRNSGRGAALNVRAILRTEIWPNPIYLRWAGAVEEDQIRTHIPAGETRFLDLISIGQNMTAEAGGIKWFMYQVVTQDRILRHPTAGMAYKLIDRKAPGPHAPYDFELELFTDSKMLGRCDLKLEVGSGMGPPVLQVGPMMK